MNDKVEVKRAVKRTAESIEENILKRLGLFFKELREGKGYSVRKLTDLSGVSGAAISDLENLNTMPRIETIIKLALALDITDIDKVFLETFIGNSNMPTGRFTQLRQCLTNLDYSTGEVQRIMQYVKYIDYLKEQHIKTKL